MKARVASSELYSFRMCHLNTNDYGGNMNVSDAIRTKRAVRKFQEKHLTKEIVTAILNAGRRSQSSKNEQTWHFVAIQDKKILQALSECGQFAGHIAGAALAVATISINWMPTANLTQCCRRTERRLDPLHTALCGRP